MLTTEFVNSIFQKLSQISNRSKYIIDHSTEKYILNWFLSQNKLPHTEKALKFLIFQIYLSHPDSIELNTAHEMEELSFEYWDEIMISDCEGWYETYCSIPV